MYTREHYPLRQFLSWTRRDIFWLFGIATVPTLLHTLAGWHWMWLPWVPIALIGTSAAFTAGFRNNATYARLWEARQIFGAIVTSSRTWVGRQESRLERLPHTGINRHSRTALRRGTPDRVIALVAIWRSTGAHWRSIQRFASARPLGPTNGSRNL